MIRKIGLIIMLAIFIIIICFSISFYTNNNFIAFDKVFLEYDVAFFDYCWFGTKNDSGNLIIGCNKILTNFEDLIVLCSEWNNNAFNSEYQGNLNALEIYLAKYNAEFFINNDLIIFTSDRWNHSYEPMVQDLYIYNSNLVILVSITNDMHIDLGEYITIIIEIKKNFNVYNFEIICSEITR